MMSGPTVNFLTFRVFKAMKLFFWGHNSHTMEGRGGGGENGVFDPLPDMASFWRQQIATIPHASATSNKTLKYLNK